MATDRTTECVANARKIAPNANEGECIAALLVFIICPAIVSWLEKNDPMALKQARRALRITE